MLRLSMFRPDETVVCDHYPSRAEKIADGVVHGLGLAAAAVGGVALIVLSVLQGGPGQVSATAIYAACLVLMLTCSTLYNLTRPCPARPFLRRMDEAAIFLMIAGSYTPFTTQRLEGAWAWSMTSVVWAIAAAGVAGKLLFPKIPEKVWTLVYVAFGWVAVVAIRPMIEGVGMTAFILIAVGGLLYTTGALIFLKDSLPFRRAIWHGFVVAAALVHYIAIFTGVAAAGAR